MYVCCVVCYRVIVPQYVRSVGHVFAYLYTLMDYETSLWTMRLLYSLKFFLCFNSYPYYTVSYYNYNSV